MLLPDLHNVIDVIAHRDKQIEEQFAPILHFHLHGSAPLESLTTSDDQSKIMSAETALSVWCLVIRCNALDSVEIKSRRSDTYHTEQI
jgi:hypothetical protein